MVAVVGATRVRGRLPWLSWPTMIALGLLVLVLGLVGAGTYYLLERDRQALVQRYNAERLQHLTRVTRETADKIEDVAEDLDLAGRMVLGSSTTDDRRRILSTLLGTVRPYIAAALYGAYSQRQFLVTDPRSRAHPDSSLLRMMDRSARIALAGPAGQLRTSAQPASEALAWYRAFALSLSRRRSGAPVPLAVALLVDTRPLMDRLMLAISTPGSHLLVIGPHGRATASSDLHLRQAHEALQGGRGEQGLLGRIVRKMRSGKSGTLHLTGPEARRMGLARAEMLVAWAPMRLQGNVTWAVALFTSTEALQELQRGLMWRIGLGAAGLSLALLLFGVYLTVVSWRSAVLKEHLAHASELAHAREEAEKILDHIPTCVMSLSGDGRITAMNRALSARVREGTMGQGIEQAFAGAPQGTMARMRELVREALEAHSARSLHGEHLALFGSEGQYNVHAVPLEHGFSDARALLVIEDLTEVQVLEQQLLRSEKLATVGILAAGVAHEVGTPLGVARGRAEYMLGKVGPDHPEAVGLRTIMEQIDRVTCTIRELLDFSRPRAAEVSRVDLLPLGQKVVELLRYEAGRRTITLVLDVLPGLPLLSANADQLQQVLVNLLLNACDASSPGGRVTLSAGLHRGGESRGPAQLRVEVADLGCGIPAESLNRIFDPFFTTKKRGQGTGLGLTIVSQVVRAHGAQIRVESTPGRGTRVLLLWPVAGPATREAHA